MRIAHMVSHDVLNGVATSCRTLIEAQRAAGHDVFLAVRPRSWLAANLDLDGLTLLESTFKTRPREIARVGLAIRRWGCDVVHCHGSRANKYGLVYRFAGAVPVVATAHAALFQLPWRWFSAVIAPSREVSDYHLRHNLVPRRRMHRVFNIVRRASRPSAEERDAIRREFGLDDGDFVLGMVGAIDGRKNQVEALHILRRVARDVPQARLVLVGGLPQAQEPMPGWNDAVADPEIAPRLILAGHRPDAMRLMAAFDVCLFVSSKEPGPLAPLENMSLGVPLVAYEVGCLPEIIDNGVNGFLVAQGDRTAAAERVVRLYRDRALAAAMGAKGAATIEAHFAPEAVERKIAAVYRAVIGSRPPARPAPPARGNP